MVGAPDGRHAPDRRVGSVRAERARRAEAEGMAEPGSLSRVCYEGDFNRIAGCVKRGDWSKDDLLADFCRPGIAGKRTYSANCDFHS